MIKFEKSLYKGKNLLAFSAGVDSTALFFLLLEQKIDFDIAIVDYNQRDQSKDEVIYATQLAHKYNKRCFIKVYDLEKFTEKMARDFRYEFFEQIISKESYSSLLTAHQLNDKLEWFLMQLTKGAGSVELMGLHTISKKENYTLYRPLLQVSKQKLQEYLDTNNIKYFIDQTNFDERYKRNHFRQNFSDELIQSFEDGIKRSFQYIQNDIDSLLANISIKNYKQLAVIGHHHDNNTTIRVIDQELKKRGFIITKATRDEIINNSEVVISHTVTIVKLQNTIYIAPYIKTVMDKKFKELCRIKKIPSKIRGYLYTNQDLLEMF